MRKPELEIVESVVTPNKPFFLDDIEIGTQANRPPGEGWEFAGYLIHEKATRWVRRRPARLPRSVPHD
jgi:hypothetical protein